MAKEFHVFVTGGTGYMGSRLISILLTRGHRVRAALARGTSIGRVPSGATPVIGDPLDTESVFTALRSGDTVVHLVGTPHPNPSKAKQFKQIDLVSIGAMVTAAKRSGNRPTGLRKRGATGAGHACLHRSTHGGRGDD